MDRRKTRKLMAGGVAIGANAPVTVQSMCNTETWEVDSTVEQILALEAKGCDIVRVSVYSEECAKAIRSIKKCIHIPLVADVHFDHRLAISAIENGVDKLRINPGNIGGAHKVRELTAAAKEHGVPIRIGVNGGSLEKALLHKYGGPTADALVDSAMGHLKLLEDEGFFDVVLSVKSSDVRSMIEANRKLAALTDCPIHLGVTEAGAGSDAVVKSAIGIGTLLAEGIGDTVRISITGDPCAEIAPALSVLRALNIRKDTVEIVSCPTCGRCKINLLSVVDELRDNLPSNCGTGMKIAVMGCVVNGPGEAREADLGIAFAPDGAVLFSHGKKLCSYKDHGEAKRRLIAEASSLCASRTYKGI